MSAIEMFVTNTETLYPRRENNLDEVVVRLYGRTEDQAAETITVTGFDPYFYIPADETDVTNPAEHDDLVGYEETDVVPLADRFLPVNQQRALVKANVRAPSAIRDLRQRWDTTWGADEDFANQLRIEKGIRTGVRAPDSTVDVSELEAVEMHVEERVLTFDIETDDRGTGFPDPGEARILSIAAHDSYTDEYVTFIDLDGLSVERYFGVESVESLADIGLTEPDKLITGDSEKAMLKKFAHFVETIDPDLVSGWNSGDDANDGFDLPHLIERMDGLGINPARLSREGYVDCTDLGDDEWRVSIQGRTTYDLMDAWAGTKFTEPDSKRLDDVAELALDDAKIEHPDQGYFEMYSDDPVTFIEYNTKDTRLTVEIAEAENVFGFKSRLRRMIGVDWEETRENNEFVSMSIRRKCAEYGLSMITAWDNPAVKDALAGGNDEVNYEGAYVFDAFTGLKRNVVGVDLASLYPMTQWMLNASPDTKVDRKWAWKNDVEHVVAANGVTFRTDVDSIIRELVDEYDELKMEFKRKRNAAEYGTALWEEMAEAYNVTKTIYNSFYGYTGWDKSPLYDPDIAAAVTLTGQRVIKRTAEYIGAETEGDVVYGDTDSNYVEFPGEWGQVETLEYAEQMCATLTEEVYPDLCGEFDIDPANNRWEIETEMRAETFFMSDKKKAYAYLKMWDEGDAFDTRINDGKGKFSVTGYVCVKSNFAQITKETQRDILELIVRDGSNQEVADRLFEAASSIDPASPDWDAIGMPQGLGQKISKEKAGQEDYFAWSTSGDYPQSAHPRGAWFANHLLDVKYGKGSKPKRAYLKPTLTCNGESVDVIAYESERDLDPLKDELQMDTTTMQQKVLVSPIEDIIEANGMKMDAALMGKAHQQAGLGGFC